MTMTSEPPIGLTLRSIQDPASTRLVGFFSTARDATNHLAKHLLESPEAELWALLLRHEEIDVDLTDDQTRRQFLRILEQNPSAGQKLYEAYLKAVSQDGTDATSLKWFVALHRGSVSMGTTGILIVIANIFKTAFLAGQGSPKGEGIRLEEAEASWGSPAERGMRKTRPDRYGGTERERDRLAAERREAAWTWSQRVYYRVFRVALQFVWSKARDGLNMNGERPRDYYRLKQVLPHRAQLPYEKWVELRRSLGREA